MTHKLLILIPCAVGFIFSANAQEGTDVTKVTEVTSENGPRVKAFYEKFPKSDLNKDGILTMTEMYDFLDAKLDAGARSDNKGTSFIDRIYLKLILKKSPDTDLDGDGVLTKQELLEFVKQNNAVPVETPVQKDQKVAGVS